MYSEKDLLSAEIHKLRLRIAKCDRRINANKVLLNGEPEQDRQNRLLHVLGKKQERLVLILSGKEC